jgi:hypothetical protein
VPGMPSDSIVGYSLACGHPEALAARCSEHGMAPRKRGERYSVALPAALGGTLLFG